MDIWGMLGGIVMGAALILVVPGPTNTLLLTAGYLRGIRRAAPLVAAEMVGYGLAISVWGFFLFALATHYPLVMPVARLSCALFIVLLALRVWRTPALAATGTASPITLRTMFTATLLNPKALIFASAVFPREVYGLPELFAYALVAFWLTIAPSAWPGSGWGRSFSKAPAPGCSAMYHGS